MSQFNPTNNFGIPKSHGSFFNGATGVTIGSTTVQSFSGDYYTEHTTYVDHTTYCHSPGRFGQPWGGYSHVQSPPYERRETLSPEPDTHDLGGDDVATPEHNPSGAASGSTSHTKSKTAKVKARMSGKRGQDSTRPVHREGWHHKQEDLKKVLERAYRNRAMSQRRLEWSELQPVPPHNSGGVPDVETWDIMTTVASGRKVVTTLVGRRVPSSHYGDLCLPAYRPPATPLLGLGYKGVGPTSSRGQLQGIGGSEGFGLRGSSKVRKRPCINHDLKTGPRGNDGNPYPFSTVLAVRMATPSDAEGSGDKGDLAVQTVDRQSNPTPSASTQTKPSKPKAPRSKHKRGSSGTNPRNSNPNPTSSSASTSGDAEAELAATPLPRRQEKYAMTRGLSPFWRTPRGYAVLALIVLVIILAIVGAAVGGSIANREAQKVDEREAAASSAAAESSASLAALAQATHSDDHTTTSIGERDLAPQYAYATTANTRYHVPRQTENPWPAQTTVSIRGRKPPARGPTN